MQQQQQKRIQTRDFNQDGNQPKNQDYGTNHITGWFFSRNQPKPKPWFATLDGDGCGSALTMCEWNRLRGGGVRLLLCCRRCCYLLALAHAMLSARCTETANALRPACAPSGGSGAHRTSHAPESPAALACTLSQAQQELAPYPSPYHARLRRETRQHEHVSSLRKPRR